MWHARGYGGWGKGEAVVVPGFDHVLVTDWNADNRGLHPEREYIDHLRAIQKEWPHAQVVVSTFDNFTEQLIASGAKRINERWTRAARRQCVGVSLLSSSCRVVSSGVTGRSGEASRRLVRGSVSTTRGGGSSVATLLGVVGNFNLSRGGFSAGALRRASASAIILKAIGREKSLPGSAQGLTRRGALASANSRFSAASTKKNQFDPPAKGH